MAQLSFTLLLFLFKQTKSEDKNNPNSGSYRSSFVFSYPHREATGNRSLRGLGWFFSIPSSIRTDLKFKLIVKTKIKTHHQLSPEFVQFQGGRRRGFPIIFSPSQLFQLPGELFNFCHRQRQFLLFFIEEGSDRIKVTCCKILPINIKPNQPSKRDTKMLQPSAG